MEIVSLPQLLYLEKRKIVSLSSSRACETNRLKKRRSFL